MTHTKWAIVVALIVASTFLLSFTYQMPPQGSASSVAAGLGAAPILGSAAPTLGSPSLTPTLAPSPSVTLTVLQSATPSATPKATATVILASPTPAVTITATLSAISALTVTLPAPGVGLSTTQPITSAPLSITWPFDTRADLPRYLYVDQGTQHLYVFEQGQLLRDIPCSAGLPYSNTYTPAWEGVVGEYWGTFFAFDVFADDAWYLFKSDGSILIHSLPYTITVEDGPKEFLDRDALGVRPSSHGCIRLAPEDAAWLTQWNPEGVPITVTDPYRSKWQ